MANDLPPLPEHPKHVLMGHNFYTADQMHAYARAAVQAEREAAAKLCELQASIQDKELGCVVAHCCAAAIRARSTP